MTPHDRAALVLAEAWRLLPPLKAQAPLVDIQLVDLGAKHGTYFPDAGVLHLSTALFTADPLGTRRLMDYAGNDPARLTPYCPRDAHTAIHELSHALGAGTGLDCAPGWLQLSGWVEAADDPVSTARYWERRPGWPHGPSSWRYRVGTWFGRDYSSKSPFEDFADGVTALCLGWQSAYGPAAQPKFQWLRRQVFGETGPQALQAATARWRFSLDAHMDAALSPAQRAARTRRTTAEALTHRVSVLLAQWLRDWHARWSDLAAAAGGEWPSLARLAHDLLEAVRPPITRLWQSLTTATVPLPPTPPVQAAVTFAQTTLDRLRTLVPPALTHGRAAVQAALAAVHADALTTRTPLMVESLLRHVEQGAARQTALLTGATHATWRTTSGHPCAWCADLEGQTFALTRAPLWAQGATLVTGRGKEMALDYEDIWHPPIHIHCQCVLDYF